METAGSTMIIDTDTHFTEPPDLWTSRLPKRWGDKVLHVEWDDESKTEYWCLGDRKLRPANCFLNYGYRQRWPNFPKTLDEAHPATYIQSERLKIMDEYGVRAAVLYPNIGGLDVGPFLDLHEPEIAIAHLKAYNDYQLEWCAEAPGRFIPMLVVPFWDVAEAVAEIERMAGRGFGGIVTTGAPQRHGQPFLNNPHWDPLWQACVDARLSVNFHVANAGVAEYEAPERIEFDPPGALHARIGTMPFLDNAKQIADVLLSGVLVRFPDLKFVSVESCIGWVPFVLESLDYHFKRASVGYENHPYGDLLPSDLFHRQIYVNYWFERLQPWHVEAIGIDNILFETDFPHSTCLAPADVKRQIEVGMAALSPLDREKILWRNAAKLYNVDVDVVTNANDAS